MKIVATLCAMLIVCTACASAGAEHSAMEKAAAEKTGHKANHHMPHIITTQSRFDFETTLSRAKSAIDARGFKTFAVIDHAAGAASINADLPPTTLIIFGNPKGGTPLMQANQKLGLRLPLKLLVTEDAAGNVAVDYTDMAHLFHEYGISEMTGPLGKISGALAAIAEEASTE